MKHKLVFIRIVYWFGAIADLLLFLDMMLIMLFGVSVSLPIGTDKAYQFMLPGNAALMLGWTFVLVWAQAKPIERKEILLVVGIMIFAGELLNISNILHMNQLIAIFTMIIYFVAYFLANGINGKSAHSKQKGNRF
jgi:hypothetical protein